MKAVVTSPSAEWTYELGKSIGTMLNKNTFLALFGELGAGKTAFARGIGAGLQVEGITSPTFTILHSHEGTLPFHHFDAYRLSSGSELYDIGYEKDMLLDSVTLMEWPENVIEALPDDRINIRIDGSGNEARRLLFEASDPKYAHIITFLQECGGDQTC